MERLRKVQQPKNIYLGAYSYYLGIGYVPFQHLLP